MSLEKDQASWEHFGREDPLWAVCTDAGRRHGGWDDAAFFTSGEREIERVFAFLEAAGLVPAAGRALDFGCGVGRLTRALSPRFAAVTGVDISRPMLDAAARRNHDRGNVAFVHAAAPGELAFARGTCDFVISLIALQHVTDRAAIRGYLGALAAALRPQGVGVVQLPSSVAARIRWHPLRVIGRTAPRLLLRGPSRVHPYAMTLSALSEEDVTRTFRAAGVAVEHVIDDHRSGTEAVASRSYVISRSA